MDPAFLVRLRPAGPWRIGPDSGARNRVDCVFHSDTLFSAVSNAMALLGQLDEWLAATALHPDGPAVRFSSLFPFLDDLLFVPPPRHLWPPAPSGKVRWKGARFVPLSAASLLLADKNLDENRWNIDGPSECLLPTSRNSGPFRQALRTHSSVDRITGTGEARRTACIEFASNAGLWAVAAFANEEAKDRWAEPVKAAFRLLADSGLGGERSIGWGRAEQPEFRDGVMPDLVYKAPHRPAAAAPANGAEAPPKPGETAESTAPSPAGDVTALIQTAETGPLAGSGEAEGTEQHPGEAAETDAIARVETAQAPKQTASSRPAGAGAPAKPPETAWWLLSLFAPGATENVDWRRGSYSILSRGGRIESRARSGDEKKLLRMVEEGSVILSEAPPNGAAPDVAPDGFPHPVFRAGFAVAVPITLRAQERPNVAP